MRILIISQYFPPDITAAANRISELAALMAERGHEVSVITSTPHKSDHEAPIQNDPRYRVERVAVEKLTRTGFTDYLKQFLGFSYGAFQAARRLSREEKYDVVWITSPPLTVVLSSLLLRLFSRQRIVLDVRDIWPESAISIGKLSQNGLSARLGRILEKLAYWHAHQITCVSENMAGYIRDRSNRPVHVVYNGVSTTKMPAYNVSGADPDRFYYAGNIGFAQDMEPMVRAFAKAKHDPVMAKARLIVIGDGVLRADMEALAQELDLGDAIEFPGPMPKTELTDRLYDAGTLIVPLMHSPAFELTVPSKVFDCMSFGRPVLSNISGEGRRILERSGGNLVAAHSDVSALADGFVALRKEWDERLAKAKANVAIVRDDFSREASAEVLEAALMKAAGNAG